MDIKFFGSSVLRRDDDGQNTRKTFVDLICEHYEIPVDLATSEHYSGLPKCSEERILFYLKKVKNPDLVVIFHAHPSFVFFPSWMMDLRNGSIDKNVIEHWSKTNHKMGFIPDFRYITAFDEYIGADDIAYDWTSLETSSRNYQEFFHPDLQRNRYYGALIQIDQYITSQNIRAVHIPYSGQIPPWFKFSSGIVDEDLSRFQYDSAHSCSYATWPNAITESSNKMMADQLIGYIDTLMHE